MTSAVSVSAFTDSRVTEEGVSLGSQDVSNPPKTTNPAESRVKKCFFIVCINVV